jgi:hypothetical protein
MKRQALTKALLAALLTSPAAFADQYIPWHWDDVEEHTVVQQTQQVQEQDADDEKWTSDIGW